MSDSTPLDRDNPSPSSSGGLLHSGLTADS